VVTAWKEWVWNDLPAVAARRNSWLLLRVASLAGDNSQREATHRDCAIPTPAQSYGGGHAGVRSRHSPGDISTLCDR
jgi:hypothetical protein